MIIKINNALNINGSVGIIIRRMVLNSGKLLSANVFLQIIGFVTLLISARVLGPENYGRLGLIIAFVQTTGVVISFQAWQVIIKFGSELIEEGDLSNFSELIILGFSLDIGAAIFSTAVAYLISDLTVRTLGWPTELVSLMRIYCFSLLFSVNSTPTGILRLFDRFDLLSLINVISGLTKLAGIGWCVLSKQSLIGFVWTNLIVVIVSQTCLIVTSILVLWKKNIRINSLHLININSITKRHTGIWNYVWTTNLNSTMRMIAGQADLMVISIWVSPAGVGFYKLAKQAASIFGILTDPLYQTIYPELAKLWARKDIKTFISLTQKSSLIAALIAIPGWICFVLLGRRVIELLLGHAYLDVYTITLLYLIGTMISIITFPFQPAMLSVGHPEKSFIALSISAVSYLASIAIFVPILGVNGASVSYIFYYIIWTVIIGYFLLRYLNTESNLPGEKTVKVLNQ